MGVHIGGLKWGFIFLPQILPLVCKKNAILLPNEGDTFAPNFATLLKQLCHQSNSITYILQMQVKSAV
jgi:hypothetical protein